MAFRLPLRPLSFTLGLGITSAFAAHRLYSRSLLCEPASQQVKGAFGDYQRDAKVPIVKRGRVNTAAYKQISSGSLLGLLSGVAVSTFSRTLAFLFGLLIFGGQYIESKGIHIIPTERLQRYVKSINLQSLVEDNVAFKLSFGATFMLAAFAEL